MQKVKDCKTCKYEVSQGGVPCPYIEKDPDNKCHYEHTTGDDPYNPYRAYDVGETFRCGPKKYEVIKPMRPLDPLKPDSIFPKEIANVRIIEIDEPNEEIN